MKKSTYFAPVEHLYNVILNFLMDAMLKLFVNTRILARKRDVTLCATLVLCDVIDVIVYVALQSKWM